MKKIFYLIIVPTILSFTNNAFAYHVVKVKNKKILITFSPEENVQTKDTFYAINNTGKKKAIVLITKVKGNKAIAKILKGRAEKGWTLRVRKRSVVSRPVQPANSYQPRTNTAATSSYPKKSKKLFNHLSFLWGYSLNRLQTSFEKKTIKHSASSFFNFETSTTLFLPKEPMFGLKILSSTENFTLKAKCSDGTTTSNCAASIVYLGGGALAVIQAPLSDKFSLWGGVGGKLLFPVYKKITTLAVDYHYLDKASIKLTSALLLSGGFTLGLNSKFSIPFNVNYTLFPSSAEVKGHSSLNFQTGLLYHF